MVTFFSCYVTLEDEVNLLKDLSEAFDKKLPSFDFTIGETRASLKTDQIIGFYSRPYTQSPTEKSIEILEKLADSATGELPGDEWKNND